MCTSNRQSGISLVELIMFIVIVSIALAGVTGVLNLNTTHGADPMVRKQAMAIAESLLEEIEHKEFLKPADGFTGPFTPVNRALFDTVSDYNGFATNGIFSIDNTQVLGLEGYSVAVTVAPSALGAITDALLITVTVTGPGSTPIIMNGYRTRH